MTTTKAIRTAAPRTPEGRAAAQAYLQQGWCPIPVRGKTPALTTWREFQTRLPRLEEVDGWQWPGVAVVCGKVSAGLLVLDIDGEDGAASVRGRQLPPTVMATTPNGTHYYFHWTRSEPCPGPRVGLLAGVDIRAEGSYVVAPPTVRPDGGRYIWADRSSPDETDLAVVPDWLAELLLGAPGEKRAAAPASGAIIPSGMRNTTLTSLAGTMRRRGMSEETIYAALLSENKHRCDPPLPEGEVRGIARSVARYGPASGERRQTDMGNAAWMVELYGDDLRYCHKWHKWLVWNGQRWRTDDEPAVMQRAKRTVQHLYMVASQIGDENRREAAAKWAMRSESRTRLQAMIGLARSEPGVPVESEELDANPWLFNCENGTLDLRTGQLRRHDRRDLCTMLAPVEFDATARCPKWEAFLERVMDGNRALIRFLQRAAGYSLTGDVSEHVLFFLYGTGANGKTTFINTQLALMGQYGRQADSDLLLATYNRSHPTNVARLAGARFVACAEVEEGCRIAESLVKSLTGGDRRTARRMREDFWEYNPTDKIWLAANSKPRIYGQDEGIWRRIRLIPFNVAIPEDQQDRHLSQKLLDELPGILNWALEGCLAWQSQGLTAPEEVKAATASYRSEEDVIGRFVDQNCNVSPDAMVPASELYRDYVAWCKDNDEKAKSQTAFGRLLTQRGFQSHVPGDDKKRRTWRMGIGLRELDS